MSPRSLVRHPRQREPDTPLSAHEIVVRSVVLTGMVGVILLAEACLFLFALDRLWPTAH